MYQNMQLEKTSCPACNGLEYKLIFKSKDFRLKTSEDTFDIVKCRGCGFVFLNLRPADSEIPGFYPPDFNRRDRSLCYKIVAPFFRAAQRQTVRLFKQYKKVGRTLDIGCGNGEFVSVMLNEGYDAFGVEQNTGAAGFADKSVAGRILYKDISECGFPKETFDIITMFHSLEHIYNLEALFRQIKRIIKDDGLLYSCVPNTDFFEFSLFGPFAYNLEVPRHAYFFNRRTLSKFLSKFGFKPVLFPQDSLFEFILTPASVFYSVCYFFENRKMPLNSIIKGIIYLPLIFLKVALRFAFIFQNQDLKVLCRKI